MSTNNIIALMQAGQLAVDLWRAETVAVDRKAAYIRELQRFESEFGPIEGRLSPSTPEHAAIIAHTATRRAAYRKAKQQVYAIKRRLKLSSQKAARLSAKTN